MSKHASPRDGVAQRHRKDCARTNGCGCPWRASVWDNRQQRRTFKTFPSRSAAKLWRRDAQHAIDHGTMNAPSAVTVEQGIADLLDGMRTGRVLDRSGKPYKPATIRNYERGARLDVVPYLGHRKLTDVRRRDVQRWVDHSRQQGRAPSTVHARLDVLRVLYRRAMRDEVVTTNPTDGLDLPSVRREPRQIVSTEHAAALIEALPEGDRALWATLVYAGLRRGEARALRWDDVDLDANVIRVARGWDDHEGEQDPKSFAGRRTVPVAGVLRRLLLEHKLRTGRWGQDLVFGRTSKLPFAKSTLAYQSRVAWGWKRARSTSADGETQTTWEKARPDALEPLTPHQARHTCASYLIAAGLTPKQVQTYIGHSDVRTTFNVYGHLMPGDEASAAAKLDRLLNNEEKIA